MLEVKNLNTYYNNVQILWDVSLQIGEGEIVALLGENVAAKTTLLNSLTGLDRTAAGNEAFLGQEITNLPTNEIVELGIAYLPEGGRLFPDMTVQENLELGSYLKNSWKIRNKRLEEVYSIFPRLKERRKQLAKTLSGGERQMLAMGRCLMSGPKMCFFDELSYGLAPKLVKESFAMLKTLRDHGITIFMIEQNVNQSLEIADRAYVLENGRIALEGTSEELLKSDHVRKAYLGL